MFQPERRAAISPDDTISLSLSFFLLRVSLPPPDTLMSLPPSPPFTLPFRAFLFDLHPIATAREECSSYFFSFFPSSHVGRRFFVFSFVRRTIVSSARKLVDGAHRKCLRMSATMRNRVLSRVQLAALQPCPELAFCPGWLFCLFRSRERGNFQREFAFNLVKSFPREYILFL